MAASAVLLVGCDDEPRSPQRAAPAAQEDEAPEGNAPEDTIEVEPPPTPWPAEVRSLQASVADFESLEQCVAAMHDSVPVEVAELFDDIGYDNAMGEVCRSLQAAATGDVSHCENLLSSAVQRRCRTRVATLHHKPEACPRAAGTSTSGAPTNAASRGARSAETNASGRDPMCLAWATRDASLCDAVVSAERATCVAVATGEAARCNDPFALRGAAGCRAMVARFEDLVGADGPPERPAAELALSESEPPLVLPANAPRALQHGVVAVPHDCGHKVTFQASPSIGDSPGRVGLTLEVRLNSGGATLGPSSAVAIGAVGTRFPLRGEVQLDDANALELSGPFVGTFAATYTREGQEHTLTGHFRSFFRDVGSLPAQCAPPRPR